MYAKRQRCILPIEFRLSLTMCTTYVFNKEYRLLICKECNTALPPTRAGQERHLRLHGVRGAQLKSMMATFAGYGRIRSQERRPLHYLTPIRAVKHLRVEQLYACMMCHSEPFTKVLNKIGKHISSQHSILPKDQVKGVHWTPIRGQTFYSQKKHISYFEVWGSAGDAAAAAEVDDIEDRIVGRAVQESVDRLRADRAAAEVDDSEDRKVTPELQEFVGSVRAGRAAAEMDDIEDWKATPELQEFVGGVRPGRVAAAEMDDIEDRKVTPELQEFVGGVRPGRAAAAEVDDFEEDQNVTPELQEFLDSLRADTAAITAAVEEDDIEDENVVTELQEFLDSLRVAERKHIERVFKDLIESSRTFLNGCRVSALEDNRLR